MIHWFEKLNACRYPVELCEIGHNLHGLKDNNFQAYREHVLIKRHTK